MDVMNKMSSNVSSDWHSFVQRIGYLSLGSTSLLGNALALLVFLTDPRRRHEIGQRPLLFAGLVSDFVNGLAFTTAGVSGFAWETSGNNSQGKAIGYSCHSFYASAELFLQVFMALIALVTSIDRLLAIATPVFYSQHVKSRYCCALLALILVVSTAVLTAAATADGNATDESNGLSSLSHCNPYENHTFSYYYYGMIWSLLTLSVVFNLIGLASYSRLATQRVTYETPFSVANRNYLPKETFGPMSIPPPTVKPRTAGSSGVRPPTAVPPPDVPPTLKSSTVAPPTVKPPATPPTVRLPTVRPPMGRTGRLFEAAYHANRYIPCALIATATNIAICFLLPSLFFWLSVGDGNEGNQSVQSIVIGHLSCLIPAYSLMNSLIFYMIHKSSRSTLGWGFTSMMNRCRRCLKNRRNGVETTPVEVIGDTITSQSPPISLASLANHRRMKNQRPSIVPLAFGMVEM